MLAQAAAPGDAEAVSQAQAADADAERKARAAQADAERKARIEYDEAERKARLAEADAERKAKTAEVEAERKAQSEELQALEAKIAALQAELKVPRSDNAAAESSRRRALEGQIADLRREAESIRRSQAREATAKRPVREVRLGAGPDAGETMRRRQDLFLSLDRTISIELRDAPVQKAAEAMATASGIPIGVDPTVPTDKRLTVVAQVVSVKNILAEVARQTGLLIAPDRDAKGVVLRPLSSLQVNGTRVPFRAPNAPWSIEWENLPVASQMLSIMAPRVVSGYGSFSSSASGVKGGVVTLHAGLDGVTLTGMGNDRFVVASPAPAGENGVMLTVYRLEGNQLRVVSSILHRFEGGTGTPRPISANPAVVVPPQPPPRP